MAVGIFALLPIRSIKADGLFFPPVQKWMITLESPPGFSPAVDASRAYIGQRDNHLVALSLETGKMEWSVECPITAAPVVGSSSVFVGTDRSIQARSPLDGTLQWQTAVDGKIESLYWDAGGLIASTAKGSLLAVRGDDGEIVWRHDIDGSVQSAPATTPDRLFIALQTGTLLSLDRKTGELIWSLRFSKPISGMLAVGDRLYAGSFDKKFYCISTRKGHIEWSWRTGADVIGVPAMDAKKIYFVSLDNVLRALNRDSGAMLWSKSMTTRPSAGPLLHGWTLVVPAVTSELHAFSAMTGATTGDLVLLSPENQEMQFIGPPQLTSSDILVTATRGGQIQAFVSAPAPYGP